MAAAAAHLVTLIFGVVLFVVMLNVLLMYLHLLFRLHHGELGEGIYDLVEISHFLRPLRAA